MADPLQVLVVCTGNTCRSPMGARLLAHAFAAEEGPLRDVQVISAGVSAFTGDPAANNSVKALQKVGLDLSDHRSRRLTAQLAEEALAVIVMTDEHRQLLRAQMPNLQVPVVLFREKMGTGADHQVPDPYGGPFDHYLDTRDALAEAVPSLVAWLREKVDKRDQA